MLYSSIGSRTKMTAEVGQCDVCGSEMKYDVPSNRIIRAVKCNKCGEIAVSMQHTHRVIVCLFPYHLHFCTGCWHVKTDRNFLCTF